ncbi:MAG: recombinase family protein, partial [Anaerotignum sp.]
MRSHDATTTRNCIVSHDRLICIPFFNKGGLIFMRIATYIRVSTQEQALEGYSIDAQKERLTSYCKAKGWTLSAEYIDGGFSGSNLERPQMQKLISDISLGLFDGVLVYKLDRLSRSQKDTLYLIEDVFLKNNISFVSLNENFDTSTPFGRAMIGILSVFAQLEREQIKERTRMGLEERIKKGHHHSYAPFGYRLTESGLEIHPAGSRLLYNRPYK